MQKSIQAARAARLVRRQAYANFARPRQARSNYSFLLGAVVGASVGCAAAVYMTSDLTTPHSHASGPVFGNSRAVAGAIRDLQRLFPSPEQTSIDPAECLRHGSSSWFPMHNEGAPWIVVYPASTADVQEVAKIATRYRVPLIAYGAGTSIEGQFSPPHGGICLDFSNMDKILDLSEDDLCVTVQPGVGWQQLNAELDERKTGLFFPVDPGPGATIGGCIGTSCSGPNAARYGTMKEWVVTCRVVTMDGRVFDTRSRARKSSTGYDLNHLLIGAEGTLGIVTQVTLRLTNKPAHEVVGTCAFASVSQVTRAVMAAKRAGVDAQCLELLDAGNMPTINAYTKSTNYPTQPHLFFKVSGSKGSIAEDTRALSKICASHGGHQFTVSRSQAEADGIWSARKNLLLASLAQYEDASALSTDVCVPMSKLPDLVAQYRQMSDERGIVSSILGHVADGNFHSLILYREDDEASKQAAHDLSKDLLRLSLSMGGTVSGEHGVGSTKREFMIDEYGVVGIDLMMRIKDAWDPHGLLNPGKLLPDKRDLVKAKLEQKA